MPVILWQIWRFVVPALHAKEKRYAIPFILSSVALFLLGGLLAYLTLGKALRVPHLLGRRRRRGAVPGQQVHPPRHADGAAFGIGFQFPVLLVFLQLVGVLTPQQLLGAWRYAIIGIVVRRRRDHAVGRPDLAGRAGRADARAVLRRRRHRLARPAPHAAPRSAPAADVAAGRRPSRADDRRAATRSRSTTSSSRRIDALDAGHHVVVAAPTGSGKTVVAEYGIETTRRARPAGVLHGAAEGAVEPEVPRPQRRATAPATSGC